MFRNLLRIVAVLAVLSVTAYAHPGHETAGFSSGFVHPFAGWDHLLAMLAVGLWAVQLGGRALFVAPLSFVALMLAGSAAAASGLRLPWVESGVVATVFLLGVLVVAAVRLPLAASAALVGIFAFFHGLAHGAELPASLSSLTYIAGLVLASALLHAAGIGLGIGAQRLARQEWIRVSGGAIIAVAALFLFR